MDCVIDLRKNSKTFGDNFKIILSDKNNLSLYIPEGFAHAYYSYEKENIIYYKLNNYYKPKFEDGINVLDKKLKIKWPSKIFLISKKDKKLGTLENFKAKYNVEHGIDEIIQILNQENNKFLKEDALNIRGNFNILNHVK